MPRPGPPPTPTSLLAPGSKCQKRRESENHPEPKPGVPDFPDWIPAEHVDEVRAVWDALVEQIAPGVLAKCDQSALCHLCICEVKFRRASAFLLEQTEEMPVLDGLGNTKHWRRWPQHVIAENAGSMADRLRQQFGLSPSARARLEVPPATSGKDEGKGRFFDRKLGVVG